MARVHSGIGKEASSLHAPRLRLILRAGAVMLVTVLLVFIAGTLFRGGPAPASAARSWQEGYPVDTVEAPTDDFAYPVMTNTPFVFQTPTARVPGATQAPTLTFFVNATETQPPNVFLTENAELSEGMVTPLASETSGPTITPYNTATLTRVTPQPTRAPVIAQSSGPEIDWGLFWIGFSLPVLSACGVVLYLLDRRPDLFRRR